MSALCCCCCCAGARPELTNRATSTLPLRVCVFAPCSILDSGAEGRNAATELLLGVAQREQTRSGQSLSVVWSEGGRQPELETSLGARKTHLFCDAILDSK